MIHATCHTAANVRCIEFDATPWFNEADAPSIIDLAQRGWVSTAIADFLERRRGYERLHDLVEYAAKRLQPESLEDPTWETFECVVDGPDAVAWLEKNRCGEDPQGHGKRDDARTRRLQYPLRQKRQFSSANFRSVPISRHLAAWDQGSHRARRRHGSGTLAWPDNGQRLGHSFQLRWQPRPAKKRRQARPSQVQASSI